MVFAWVLYVSKTLDTTERRQNVANCMRAVGVAQGTAGPQITPSRNLGRKKAFWGEDAYETIKIANPVRLVRAALLRDGALLLLRRERGDEAFRR